jgi:hypothetical protein
MIPGHIAGMTKDVPQSSHIHPNEKHRVVRYVLENVYIIQPDEVGGHNALRLQWQDDPPRSAAKTHTVSCPALS